MNSMFEGVLNLHVSLNFGGHFCGNFNSRYFIITELISRKWRKFYETSIILLVKFLLKVK